MVRRPVAVGVLVAVSALMAFAALAIHSPAHAQQELHNMYDEERHTLATPRSDSKLLWSEIRRSLDPARARRGTDGTRMDATAMSQAPSLRDLRVGKALSLVPNASFASVLGRDSAALDVRGRITVAVFVRSEKCGRCEQVMQAWEATASWLATRGLLLDDTTPRSTGGHNSVRIVRVNMFHAENQALAKQVAGTKDAFLFRKMPEVKLYVRNVTTNAITREEYDGPDSWNDAARYLAARAMGVEEFNHGHGTEGGAVHELVDCQAGETVLPPDPLQRAAVVHLVAQGTCEHGGDCMAQLHHAVDRAQLYHVARVVVCHIAASDAGASMSVNGQLRLTNATTTGMFLSVPLIGDRRDAALAIPSTVLHVASSAEGGGSLRVDAAQLSRFVHEHALPQLGVLTSTEAGYFSHRYLALLSSGDTNGLFIMARGKGVEQLMSSPALHNVIRQYCDATRALSNREDRRYAKVRTTPRFPCPVAVVDASALSEKAAAFFRLDRATWKNGGAVWIDAASGYVHLSPALPLPISPSGSAELAKAVDSFVSDVHNGLVRPTLNSARSTFVLESSASTASVQHLTAASLPSYFGQLHSPESVDRRAPSDMVVLSVVSGTDSGSKEWHSQFVAAAEQWRRDSRRASLPGTTAGGNGRGGGAVLVEFADLDGDVNDVWHSLRVVEYPTTLILSRCPRPGSGGGLSRLAATRMAQSGRKVFEVTFSPTSASVPPVCWIVERFTGRRDTQTLVEWVQRRTEEFVERQQQTWFSRVEADVMEWLLFVTGAHRLPTGQARSDRIILTAAIGVALVLLLITTVLCATMGSTADARGHGKPPHQAQRPQRARTSQTRARRKQKPD